MKKNIYLGLSAALIVAAFFMGRNTLNHSENLYQHEKTDIESNKLNLNNEVDFKTACDLLGTVVDWNTDGEELAIFTEDGFELYCYKSENIYNNRE